MGEPQEVSEAANIKKSSVQAALDSNALLAQCNEGKEAMAFCCDFIVFVGGVSGLYQWNQLADDYAWVSWR